MGFGSFLSSIGGIADGTRNIILKEIKDSILNPKLEGIAKISEITKDGNSFYIKGTLQGFEDRPMTITCSEVEIAKDASYVKIGRVSSNYEFFQNIMDRIGELKMPIPEEERGQLKKARTFIGL